MLLSILLGNVIYYLALPVLPEPLTHHLYKVDAGLGVDFLFCGAIYLLLRKKTGKDEVSPH